MALLLYGYNKTPPVGGVLSFMDGHGCGRGGFVWRSRQLKTKLFQLFFQLTAAKDTANKAAQTIPLRAGPG
ncbi:hypothetical protein NMD14_13745 [Aeromonas veronii]